MSASGILLALLSSIPDAALLERQNARFAPVELRIDLTPLPDSERRALSELVLAAREMDALFLEQTWSGNASWLQTLARTSSSRLGKARLDAFLLNKGPWSRLDENAPFLPDVPQKPPGGAFYPEDATKAEVQKWLGGLRAAERKRAESFFTVIRRRADRTLTAVPYGLAFQGTLLRAADHLRRAAAHTQQSTLKRYLTTRAEALLSDDYYESDVAWMALDASIEPVVGPYEVYEDEWFNAKAAYEAFITVRADRETERLQRLGGQLQAIENALPLEDVYKNRKLGAQAPIRVVDSLFSSGDGNRGVQTAAFNLPNDERVIAKHGSKRVMLRNVQEAKFEKVLVPLARLVMVEADAKRLSFDAFFTHILMHELVHGLGPHAIQVGKAKTTVRARLQETYSPIEEAKADIGGLFALRLLLERGALEPSLREGLDATFVASLVRSLRFGLTEAHAKGVAVQLNWLLDAGAVRVAADGRLAVVSEKMAEAVTGLTREILRIQAMGDRDAAGKLLESLARVRPEVQKLLDAAAGVPVDIAPRFVTAEELVGR